MARKQHDHWVDATGERIDVGDFIVFTAGSGTDLEIGLIAGIFAEDTAGDVYERTRWDKGTQSYIVTKSAKLTVIPQPLVPVAYRTTKSGAQRKRTVEYPERRVMKLTRCPGRPDIDAQLILTQEEVQKRVAELRERYKNG